MNNVIKTMLSKYNPQNNEQRENAVKEILQEIALAGLSTVVIQSLAIYLGF